MTNAYLNLPGHCFVNEINSVNQINVNEINSVNQIDEHEDIEQQAPAYETNTNQIETNGITLEPDMITAFGFTSEQNITLFITQGRIVITTNPQHLALMTAIEELQLRQDEILTDFTVAIEALKREI